MSLDDAVDEFLKYFEEGGAYFDSDKPVLSSTNGGLRTGETARKALEGDLSEQNIVYLEADREDYIVRVRYREGMDNRSDSLSVKVRPEGNEYFSREYETDSNGVENLEKVFRGMDHKYENIKSEIEKVTI